MYMFTCTCCIRTWSNSSPPPPPPPPLPPPSSSSSSSSQVHCNSVDPSLNPVKGRISYDARQQRAEFTPLNTLFPNSKYTVILLGRAVTTTHCTHSANIKNAELHFNTCNPAPKHIGIKLKGQSNEVYNNEVHGLENVVVLF